jgi:hypothetical protein
MVASYLSEEQRSQQSKEPQPEGAVKNTSVEAANMTQTHTLDFSFKGFLTVS